MKNWIRTQLVILATFAAILTLPFSATAQAFLEGFPDVPLLDDFTVIDDSLMVFDTSAGTIAEISLSTNLSIGEGLATYHQSLTPLGWVCEKGGSRVICLRESSKITIIASQDRGKQSRITLRLEPKM